MSTLKTFLALSLLAFVVSAHAEKIRVQDSAAAQRLVAGGAKLIADYGAFQVIEADAALAAKEPDKVASAAGDLCRVAQSDPGDTRGMKQHSGQHRFS